MAEADAVMTVPKPDHVDDALVYPFDYYRDPDYLRDPYAYAVKVLEDAPPVFWTPYNGGHWIASSYESVSTAARDYQDFSASMVPPDMLEMMKAMLPPGLPTPASALPSSIDPPRHAAYRMPLNGVFSPKVAMGLKEEIRELAVKLIDKVAPAGRCELVGEIAQHLPVQMFLKMFGLPLERQEEYRGIVDEVMSSASIHDVGLLVRNTGLLVSAYHDTLLERRDAPRDDIISAMWRLEIDGEPMTIEVMDSYCLSLFLAGLDTVMNAIAHGTRHLAMHPELQDAMRADPLRIPQMTDEFIRLYSFAMPMRMVVRDVELGGAAMKPGDRVMMFLAAADRDRRQFADPDAFDLDRDAKAHLGFGAGAHRCVGMHLARVELHVYYEELLKRLPRFRLDPDESTPYHGGTVMGPDRVHLLWDAATA